MTFVPSILVLADDLTGAAELAAIGVEYGLTTEMATAAPEKADAALLVVDTDTRSLSGSQAAARIRETLATLPRTAVLYKKTDSVLRGQVVSELRAIQQAIALPAALLVPQNPSKGRIIADGRYLIDGVPLDQTTFRNDPEYPRTTAEVLSLLTGSSMHGDVRVANLSDGICETGITVGNAVSAAEMDRWAAIGIRDGCVMAGGADLFRALLDRRGHTFQARAAVTIPPGKTLVVCGSAADSSREIVERWNRSGLPVCLMPEGTDGPTCAKAWARAALAHFQGREACTILSIRHAVSPERAIAFRCCMAETVRQIVGSVADDFTLVIEGGATAAAIVGVLGWTAFDVEGNLSPGVVVMRPLTTARVRGRMRIILKPGSYPWPANFPERQASTRR